MHLSNEWGTAVIVQAMVFGNLNENSGSGVIFTRNPKGSSSEVSLYGDFIFGVQGDDIVSGLVETYPISEEPEDCRTKRVHNLPRGDIPGNLQGARETARKRIIYEKGFHHQEIEFTFDAPVREGLHILQTREMTQTETKRLRVFRDSRALQTSFMGAGIGISGGALSGRAVYSEDEIKHYREKEPETKLILIRPDTVSEDVGIILQVDGNSHGKRRGHVPCRRNNTTARQGGRRGF